MAVVLVDLWSENQNGTKKIFVDARVDNEATQVTLDYKICDTTAEKEVDLALGKTVVEQMHSESNNCVVVVSVRDTDERIRRALDLDAPRSPAL